MHRRSSCLLLCSWSVAVGLSAQSSLTLRGSVSDSTGAIVPGAALRIETPQHQSLAETRSGSAGNFTFRGLPAGELTLVVPATVGFAALSMPLHLTASGGDLKVILPLAGVSETITVEAGQAISADPSSNRDTISTSADDLRKLPVFDQNIVAALTPFLDPAAGGSGGATIIVDGVEMKSSGVSPSSIQEVRINNDPYSAEFTRPGRGRIEITTKPGSPNFHGEANFIFRDALFNAANFFSANKPAEQRRIYEGHLTGPVGHAGHTTFLLSGTHQENDLVATVHAFGSNGVIDAEADAPIRDSELAFRVTRDFSPAHRLFLQYNIAYYTQANANVGGLVLPEAGYATHAREDDLVLNDRLIVTPNLVNQLQASFEKDEDNVISASAAPTVQVSGGFTRGGAQADLNHTENTLHLNDVLSWTHGRHYLRAGAQLPQLSRRAVDDRTNRLGTFSFASLAAYNAATPYSFTVQQGPGRGLYWINEIGAFVQDQIKLTPRLQLSLGLRYDWQTYVDDVNNLSPRISAAYSLGKKTILRGGSGFFYDRTGGDFPATIKLHNGSVLRTLQVLNPSYPSAVAPGVDLASLPTNLVRFAPGALAPYAVQYSVSAERQLAKNATLTIGYRGFVQAKSFRSRDANAPVLSSNAAPGVLYPRPDPAYGFIQQIESGGRQIGNAMDLNFRGQAGRWFSGQAQYTLARNRNNTGGINSYPQDQYHPNAEWGRADSDRLHKFNLIGDLNPDHWLSLGIALALLSGAPYTETAGADLYQTGLNNARPAGVGRNTLQGGSTISLDLLWSHDFHLTRAARDKSKLLTPGLSAFNVLNHPNFINYVGNRASPLFAQPTNALPGRQIQLSFGYRF